MRAEGVLIAYIAAVGLAGWAVPLWHVPAFRSYSGVPVTERPGRGILTDPYLQAPGPDHVHVHWLSGIAAGRHVVLVGAPDGDAGARPPSQARSVPADTARVPRMFEDGASQLPTPTGTAQQQVIYRHAARIDALTPGMRYPYWVRSTGADGQVHDRGPFTLGAAPRGDAPVTLLLTSDFQQKPNALVAYQRAVERYPTFDGVLFAGDLVQHPRRASDWVSGHVAGARAADPAPAFFDALQGRYRAVLPDAPFAGGALLQSAPLYPAVGNHEVSGRFRLNTPVPGTDDLSNIAAMYNDPQPRWVAEGEHAPEAVADQSHDFETYRALFRQPPVGNPAEGYYATRIGDVFLVTLNVSRIWRRPIAGHPHRSGKYDEGTAVLNDPDRWGFGEFLFGRIDAAAPQVEWLRAVLDSSDARGAKYRVAMLHQSAFGLGANSVPVLADPVWTLEAITPDGARVEKHLTFPPDPAARRALFEAEVAPLVGHLTALRYDYPRDADLFATVLEPALRAGGIDLVLTGHSHIWNRFRSGDMHLLESSNAGNCYGAFWTGPDGRPWQGRLRDDAPGHQGFWTEVAAGLRDPADYPRTGDPQGRVPVMPTGFNPMLETDESTVPVPFVCSNRLSVFSVLDSAAGVVRSYVIDTADPDAQARAFDRFALGRQ